MNCSLPGSSVQGFPRQEYWCELSFPYPGVLPNPEIKHVSPTLAGRLFTTETPGKPKVRNALYLLGWPKCWLRFFPYDLMENIKQSFWPTQYLLIRSFPSGSDGKESAYNVGDPGLISGLERSMEKEMAIHSSGQR